MLPPSKIKILKILYDDTYFRSFILLKSSSLRTRALNIGRVLTFTVEGVNGLKFEGLFVSNDLREGGIVFTPIYHRDVFQRSATQDNELYTYYNNKLFLYQLQLSDCYEILRIVPLVLWKDRASIQRSLQTSAKFSETVTSYLEIISVDEVGWHTKSTWTARGKGNHVLS